MPRPTLITPLALALTLPLVALSAPATDAGTPQAAPDPKLLERARSILQRAPLIDTHNDLPYALFLKNGGDITKVDLGKRQPGLPRGHPELREGRVRSPVLERLRGLERSSRGPRSTRRSGSSTSPCAPSRAGPSWSSPGRRTT